VSAVTELPEVVAATTAQYLDLIDQALRRWRIPSL
jgi:hypothetical protein